MATVGVKGLRCESQLEPWHDGIYG